MSEITSRKGSNGESRTNRRTRVGAALAVAGSLMLTGCSDDKTGPTGPFWSDVSADINERLFPTETPRPPRVETAPRNDLERQVELEAAKLAVKIFEMTSDSDCDEKYKASHIPVYDHGVGYVKLTRVEEEERRPERVLPGYRSAHTSALRLYEAAMTYDNMDEVSDPQFDEVTRVRFSETYYPVGAASANFVVDENVESYVLRKDDDGHWTAMIEKGAYNGNGNDIKENYVGAIYDPVPTDTGFNDAYHSQPRTKYEEMQPEDLSNFVASANEFLEETFNC